MKRILATCLVLASAGLSVNSALADRLDQMISPAFHPVTFEDPQSRSELRAIYANHAIDDQFVTQGGDAQVYALQVRYALSDKLAIIATKDGIVDFNPKAALPKETGLADVEAGLKYVFHRDAAAGQVASVALRYLIPVGDEDVLQGTGDGEIHPSISAAFALSNNLTLTAGSGLRLPMDSDFSTAWDFDAQLDYRIDTSMGAFYPLFGASVIHILDDGKRLGIADEGQDFFNFGATEAGGKSITTGVGGLRFVPCQNWDIGATYQFPFNSGNGNRIIDYRWLFDVIYRF